VPTCDRHLCVCLPTVGGEGRAASCILNRQRFDSCQLNLREFHSIQWNDPGFRPRFRELPMTSLASGSVSDERFDGAGDAWSRAEPRPVSRVEPAPLRAEAGAEPPALPAPRPSQLGAHDDHTDHGAHETSRALCLSGERSWLRRGSRSDRRARWQRLIRSS